LSDLFDRVVHLDLYLITVFSLAW